MKASFGVGGFEGPDRPEFKHLLPRADQALCEVKKDGRVRVKRK